MFGEKIIRKLDPWGSWLLLLVTLAFVLTGFDMTKRFYNPALSHYIHVTILPAPFFFLVILHVLKPVRAALKKWNIFTSHTALDIYTYALALICLGLALWFQFR
ncbi:MAG: hypothetical protein HQL23_03585 [Candidatus Omnitrophica bacterium]|nr:hypothetical protein [Candidatus Omnitrophota bacterium]